MHPTPDDLKDIQSRLPKEDLRISELGLVRAFTHTLKLLEPGMVFPDGERAARTDWIVRTSLVVTVVERWLVNIGPTSSAGEKNISLQLPREHIDVLVSYAARFWATPSTGPIRGLPKVKDAELQRIATRDLASLRVAQQTEQAKMVLVLAGSVIEAALLDLLLQDEPGALVARDAVHAAKMKAGQKWQKPGSDVRAWTFNQMIDVCGPDGMRRLGESTLRAAHAARDYRNYVHPNVEKEQSPLRLAEANVAAALVDLVLADMGY
jgi:hypothetical protein